MASRSDTTEDGDTAPLRRARQRGLLEANLDAVVIIGPSARIDDANTALETVTGRSRPDLIGSDASAYFTDPEAARRLYRDVLRDGAVRDRLLELVHQDGHVTQALCSASAYRDRDGKVMGVVAAARPISAAVGESAAVGVDPRLQRAAQLTVASASLLSIGVGAVALAAHAWPALAGVATALPAPAAAACFVALGGASWALGAELRDNRHVALTAAGRLLTAAVAAIAGSGLAASLGRAAGARMDGWSALGLLALALALLGLDFTVAIGSKRYWPAHALAFAAGTLSIAGLLDPVLGLQPPLTTLPLSSSTALFGLALGVVCTRVDYSLGALLTSGTIGGMLTRHLWPAAVLVPMLLGLGSRGAVAAGLLPGDGAAPALILSMITLLGALAIWSGQRVDQIDRVRQRTQQTLSRRESELREAHRLARIGSWRWDLAEDRVTWSPELYRLSGRDPTRPPPRADELIGPQAAESAARFQAALAAARSSGTPFELEVTLLRPDGTRCFATARGEADRGADGSVQLLRGTVEDITERKVAEAELARVHRAQRASSRCNQVLVRASDEATLLQQVCNILIENTDYRSCWVGQAENDAAKSVRIVARAGASDGYLDASTFSWGDGPDPDGVGGCIRSGRTVLFSDLRKARGQSARHERALAHGIASLVAIPLEVDGRTYGALVIYASEPHAFGVQELSLITELADDLAFGLTTLHTRAAHERAEACVRQLNAELEQRVQSRTAELRTANVLKDSLLLRQQATSAELERAREREADVGFRIQKTLLLDPPPSDLPGLTVAASTTPSQRIDGDFYAFINHHDRVLDVIVGDVMGKGILAALLGAATKAHFLKAIGDLAGSRAPGTLPRPKDIVMMAHAGVARHLIELESFVTLCYARIDLIDHRLDFVDCGHTGIILSNAATGNTRLLQGTNLPLGVREGETYEQVSVPLSPGDTLLLFSDGLTEARDEGGENFGTARLERLVGERCPGDPAALVTAIGAAVHDFSGMACPRDDQTCVALHIESTPIPVVHADLEIKSALEELGRAREFLRDFCQSAPGRPLDEEDVAELVLASNEAISNIMKHAYGGDRDQLLNIEADAFADRVSVRLRHVGSPFSPDAAPAPDFDGSRDSGFGAYMIASSVDEVKYYRDTNGRSCVSLFKKPSHRPPPQEHSPWTRVSNSAAT